MDEKYFKSYDEFLKERPEIEPEWREFMEPVIQGQENAMYAFIMSYIFM